MRFVMKILAITCVALFAVAEPLPQQSPTTLPQAPKPYEKDDSPKVQIGGEILLRYEKQSTSSDSLKRASKGSQGTLNLSVE